MTLIRDWAVWYRSQKSGNARIHNRFSSVHLLLRRPYSIHKTLLAAKTAARSIKFSRNKGDKLPHYRSKFNDVYGTFFDSNLAGSSASYWVWLGQFGTQLDFLTSHWDTLEFAHFTKDTNWANTLAPWNLGWFSHAGRDPILSKISSSSAASLNLVIFWLPRPNFVLDQV